MMDKLVDRLLALIVYKGIRFYLRRRVSRFVPSRRSALAAVLGLALVGAAIAAVRRSSGPSTG
jgi:hypothetical protein